MQINHITEVAAAPQSLPSPSTVVARAGTHNLPHPPSGLFVGRAVAMTQIAKMAERGDGAIAQTLHGLGGIGKTELVLQFAHAHRDRYPLIWWINAATRQQIELDLADLTQRLQPTTAPLSAAAAWSRAWLQDHSGWLLILDNVEDPADIGPLLGQIRGRGRVIITTRRDLGAPTWSRLGFQPLRLPPLNRHDSADLLTQTTGVGSRTDEADDLAEDLGDLPLALTQAAAYIAQRQISVGEYRNLLRNFPARIYATVPDGFPAEKSLFRVWALTAKTIAERSPIAPMMLKVMAYLAPDNLPEELFRQTSDNQLDIDDALAALASYSMISRSAGMMSVHRLVQGVTRAQATPAEATSAMTAAVSFLCQTLWEHEPAEVKSWPRWKAFLPHIESLNAYAEGKARVSLLWWLLDRAATYWEKNGNFDRALQLFETALADLRAHADANDPALLIVKQNLAHAYLSSGKPTEAVELYEEVLPDMRVVLGDHHRNTLACTDNLAAAYSASGRFIEAIVQLEATLELYDRMLGSDNPNTSTCRTNLAFAYQEVGRLPEAIRLFVQVLAARNAVADGDPGDSLNARNNLAQAYGRAGYRDVALKMARELVDDARGILSGSNPDMLTYRGNLADAYRGAGRATEAVTLQEAVLDDCRQAIGREHRTTLICLSNLANAYRDVGRIDEAISAYTSARDGFRARLGDQHPDTLKSGISLANAWLIAGSPAEAAALLEAILPLYVRVFGEDHPDIRAIRENLVSARHAAR